MSAIAPTDGAPDLTEIADAARASGRIALDTEFMGEGRYRTLLCLIQLAVPDGATAERIELVDPLAEELDGAPLADVLADPDVQVVVHAGRQDIALVRRRLGTEVRNVFDTQVAAGFAGMAAQASYETLLSELLDVRVAKSASFTRWDARPLSPEQREYAREDVVHLLELAGALERRLAELGRLEWAREECEPLCRSSDERDLETVFARLPRVRGLSASAQTIARELVRWREDVAATHDQPVQSVLADAALVEIAKRKPTSTAKLEQIRGVNQGSLRRRGRDLLEAVRRGEQLPPLERTLRSAPAREPSPTTRRWWRSPRRWCGRARARRDSRMSCWRRGPTCRRSSRRNAWAARRRTCARCAAGDASWSARSCWRCSMAVSRCRRAPGECERSLAPDRPSRAVLGGRSSPPGGERRAYRLFDVVVDFEQRQVHRDHDEADHAADDDDHHRLHDRGERFHRGLDLVLVELGDLVEHRVQGARFLADADHVRDHASGRSAPGRAARRSCRPA